MRKLSLLILLVVLAIFLSGYGKPAAPTKNIEVTVHSGQTLWHIVERTAIEHEDDRGMQELMYAVVEVNKLREGGAIYPGQKLIIPIRSDKNDR